jgi:PmbA protein
MIDQKLLDIATDVLARAKKAGATAADVVVAESHSTEVTMNNRSVEKIEQSESVDVGVRAFTGDSSAIISGSVLKSDALDMMVERVVAMAKLAPPDAFAGIADPQQIAKSWDDLELSSQESLTADELRRMAEEVEDHALAVPGVTKSAGAGASTGRSAFVLAISNGFAGGYRRSSFGASVSAVAGEGTGMQRDYDFHSAAHLSDLEPLEKIGRTAGERAVRRLNPRKIESQSVPIIFDRRVAGSLVSHLLGGINGSSIARGTSFLKDARQTTVFGEGVTIIDDPHRKRGAASKPFDGEGLPTQRRAIVENGRLPEWLLDLRSARKLGLAPTGQASRGLSSPPSPSTSNIYMEAGQTPPEEIMDAMRTGLLVTEFIGSTINPVTGDYSRGASGFWFENGQIAFPVSEITIGGNLRAMFKRLVPANDLIFRGSFSVPSCLVEGMTIAGR